MFVEATNQLGQDVDAVLDAALKHNGLSAMPAVARIISAFNAARPMVEPVVEEAPAAKT